MFVLFVFDLCVARTCGFCKGNSHRLSARALFHWADPFMLFAFDLCLLRKCEGHSNRYAALGLFH